MLWATQNSRPISVASDNHHFQPRAFSALYPREPKAANHRPSFLNGAMKVLVTTNSCKKTWHTVPYFGLNGLSMNLC